MQHKESGQDLNQTRKARIGRNIRQIRLVKGIEVKQLCRDLGISTAAYSNIERGVTDINLSRLMQLAEYFSIPCAHILNESAESQEPLLKFEENNPEWQTAASENLATALTMAREEIAYLKNQNNRLLDELLGQHK